MSSNKVRLGDLIAEVDNRNLGLISNKLLGVSISKEFIPSVANTIGTDLSSYKLIKRNQFACSLMQVSRDNGIAFAYYESDDISIMSPAYFIFEVVSELIDPKYLELVMKNPNFDRAAVFYAVGGVRGTLTWDEFFDMKIPVPPIEEQRKIVNLYSVLSKRIGLLKEKIATDNSLLDTLFDEYFENRKQDSWKQGTLGDLIEVRYGKDHSNLEDGDICLYGSGGPMRYVNKYLYNGESVLIPRKGSLNNILYVNGPFWTVDTMFYTVMKFSNIAKYIYLLVRKIDFLNQDSGSAVPSNTSKNILCTKILIPDEESLKNFDQKATTILNGISLLNSEITLLEKIADLMISIQDRRASNVSIL